MQNLQPKIQIIAERLEVVSTLTTAITVIYNIISGYNIITLPWFLPIPVIAVLCYILSITLPKGIERIKHELEKINIENLSEADEKIFEEIRSVIDDKTSILNTSRTSRTEITVNNEPISKRR